MAAPTLKPSKFATALKAVGIEIPTEIVGASIVTIGFHLLGAGSKSKKGNLHDAVLKLTVDKRAEALHWINSLGIFEKKRLEEEFTTDNLAEILKEDPLERQKYIPQSGTEAVRQLKSKLAAHFGDLEPATQDRLQKYGNRAEARRQQRKERRTEHARKERNKGTKIFLWVPAVAVLLLVVIPLVIKWISILITWIRS